jgi:hypothetical protein
VIAVQLLEGVEKPHAIRFRPDSGLVQRQEQGSSSATMAMAGGTPAAIADNVSAELPARLTLRVLATQVRSRFFAKGSVMPSGLDNAVRSALAMRGCNASAVSSAKRV